MKFSGEIKNTTQSINYMDHKLSIINRSQKNQERNKVRYGVPNDPNKKSYNKLI